MKHDCPLRALRADGARAQLVDADGAGDGVGRDEVQRVRARRLRDAFALLRQHLFCHVIESSGAHYVARMGIPQGSVLSARLCSMHLAAVDRLDARRRVLLRDERLPELGDLLDVVMLRRLVAQPPHQEHRSGDVMSR